MSTPTQPRDHWPLHARQWALVGPPLRPCKEDVSLAEAEVAAWSAAAGQPPRVLLLGVTPELATMAWPAGTKLLAVDRSAAMIGAIFPQTGTPEGASAERGEWTRLEQATGGFDIALGDGSLSNLRFPRDYRAFAAELRRVVAPDGRLLLRLFAAPTERETVATVTAALRAGKIQSFHALKWRLAMAVQPDDRNVRVADIWKAFQELCPDRAVLAAKTAWPAEVIATIDAYRESDVVYSFPTVAEVRATFAGHFTEHALHTPGYELGDRCPTLVLK